MSSLDFNYIGNLVRQAQEGSSNAFAELYAATYQKQYAFAHRYLGNEFLAQEAILETYTQALKTIARLRDASLVVAWLNQINFRECFNLKASQDKQRGRDYDPEQQKVVVRGDEFIVRQIMNLPFSESQVILLRHVCGMKDADIASLMEINRSEVRRHYADGYKRLKKLYLSEEGKTR